ncbi:MAG: hypothetical protein JST92_16485 [Deltaproteobacteria bacterium]|nr:hypothetical protein [Deltaproteobacteria bacterium]
MFANIEIWQLAIGLVTAIALSFFFFLSAMARFLKRPSPSEAIIRIGRSSTDVFIGRACWIVPVLHRSSTLSLTTIGLTIRRAGHDALVTQDFISTNLSAEFYIRVEPAEEDVKKAARTIGIDEGHASSQAIRHKAQELLEPKLVGALRGVAAQSDFLALHMNREHFAQEVSKALREDLGRNGFTLESVTITELAQTPLSEMRADDIFGASGRETVTNTVVAKNISVKRKVQEEAERTAEIAREQEINVATQDRLMREGKAREEEAAIKAELAKQEAVQTRDLQRQATIALEKAKKEKAEQAAEIDKQKSIEAAQVDKQKTIEAAQVDKQITLTLKAKQSAEAEAQRAQALALREKASQEVLTVQKVAEAEREKKVTVVLAEQESERQRIEADVAAYQKKVEAEWIVGIAEANREAGLKEAEVLREKVAAQNAKSRDILLQELALELVRKGPEIVRELVKPAEKITEFKVLQLGGGMGQGGEAQGGASSMLGGALGPMMKTILETSAVMPMLKDALKFADQKPLQELLAEVVPVTPVPQPQAQMPVATPRPPTARKVAAVQE